MRKENVTVVVVSSVDSLASFGAGRDVDVDVRQTEEAWDVVFDHSADSYAHSVVLLSHSLQHARRYATRMDSFVKGQILDDDEDQVDRDRRDRDQSVSTSRRSDHQSHSSV